MAWRYLPGSIRERGSLMKTAIIVPALVLAGLMVTAGAQARPDTRSMSCQQLQNFVKDNGAVVMNTGPRTYNRFVHHRGFCLYSETVGTAWVDASDGDCRLRECKPPRINTNDGRR